LGVTHVKGILLHGPPGTGKTLVARKLGALLSNGREPRVVNGPELLARWVGASEENVRNLFADAEADWKRRGDEADLHVIIFDEIDALCRARGGGGGGSGGAVGDSVVNQLLTKLDGVASAPNILVIGLTNRRDLLDEALLRPGRLEVQLEIGLPDEAGRADILRIHTRKMREAGLLACDVDVAALAARAKNFSGAELAGVVRAAASFAIERLLRPDHTDTAQHGAHARGLGLGTVHVTCADFDAALLEVAPALGHRGAGGCFGLAAQHAPRGILSTGPRVAALQAVLATLTRAASDGGDHTSPLVSALIHGQPGTGKTALAAAAADATGFPFARLVSASAEDAAGVTSVASGGGDALAGSISAAFADAYKSQRSVLVLDDLERLIGYSPVGPAYSNAALQALLVLLRRPPPHGRRMLVLGTSSNPDAMDALGISAAFGATVQVPPLEGTEVVAALLASRAFAHEHEAVRAAALMDHRVPVKHLLRLLDMARHREEAVTDAPLTVAEFRDTVLHFQT
jgi:vesicle-fusing ATPase